MAFTTIYDVKLRYTLENKVSRGVQSLTNDTRALGKEVKSASSAFEKLGIAAIGAFGFRAAGKALIGFNATVEDTKIQIAGMLALAKKTNLTSELTNADRLFASLQKRANTLPGTTMEYARMAGMLTMSITDAGLSMKDLEDLTVNTVVGAKALGVEWQAAARDVDQALRGQFHSVDVFTGKVLGSAGYKGEEGRAKYNALDANARAQELKKALTQPQFEQLATAAGATFSGALSTLEDTIGQFAGKVGLPLFKAITAEVKRWNEWIDKNTDKVDSMAKSLGEGLVKGFGVVKDALGFIVSHADLLISLGKVWAAVKIGNMLGSGLTSSVGGMAGAGGRAAGWFRGVRDSFDADGNYQYSPAGAGRQGVGGLKGALGNANMLVGAGLTGYEIGNALGFDKLGEQLGTDLAKLTGRFSTAEQALERLTKASDYLEASMSKAGDANRNPNVGTNEARKGGLVTAYRAQAEAMRDYLRSKGAVDDQGMVSSIAGKVTGGPVTGDQGRLYAYTRQLEGMGINPGDVTQKTLDDMNQKITDIANLNAHAAGTTGEVMGDVTAGRSGLTDYQRQTLDIAKAQNEVFEYIRGQLSSGLPIKHESILDLLRAATADPSGTHKTIANKPTVSIHIQRIEVQSEDPDRFAFGLVESFRQAAKNPSSALTALREG